MLELLLFGAVVLTIAACITVDILRKKMLEVGMRSAIASAIDRTKNKVTLKDLESHAKVTIQGEEISNDIYQGQEIVCRSERVKKDSTKHFDSIMDKLDNDPDMIALHERVSNPNSPESIAARKLREDVEHRSILSDSITIKDSTKHFDSIMDKLDNDPDMIALHKQVTDPNDPGMIIARKLREDVEHRSILGDAITIKDSAGFDRFPDNW